MEDVIRTLKKLIEIDDNNGLMASFIGEQALEEPYQNDREILGLLRRYRNNEDALKVINETLISVCGWSLETIYKNTYGKGERNVY